jgi:hypothetical protein
MSLFRLAGPWRAVPILGFTQIVGWGSTFYAIAVLKTDIAAETAWSPVFVVGGISIALAVGGIAAPRVGRTIARHGGRPVLALGSLLSGATLAGLSMMQDQAVWLALWALVGIAQAMTLYDAAFATLAEVFGTRARRAITALTLFAGFASTVFWPLTHFLSEIVGWRETYLIYGALNFLLCAPLHAFALPRAGSGQEPDNGNGSTPVRAGKALAPRGLPFALLALSFSINAFFMSAFAVHLVGMLELLGLTAGASVAIGALVGPSQVSGRLGEFFFAQRRHPLEVAVVTMVLMPSAFALLAFGGAGVAAIFAIAYGMAQGLLTIVRGTVPLALFGPAGYAIVLGRLAAPVLIAQAVAPILFGLALEAADPRTVLAFSAGVSSISLAGIGLVALRLRKAGT